MERVGSLAGSFLSGDVAWRSVVPAAILVAGLLIPRLLSKGRSHSGVSATKEIELEFVFDAKDQDTVSKKLDDGQVLISKIMVYPIKSCRGTSVPESKYTPSGLELDRRWAVVDAKNHTMMTARQFPKMVLIHPKVLEDPIHPTGGVLEITFPPGSGCETFSVPLKPGPEILQSWNLIEDVNVFQFTQIDGYIAQASSNSDPTYCSTVLSRFFGRPVHLAYKGPLARPAPPSWSFPELDASVVYQDAYPVMVASEESFESVKNIVRKWCNEQQNEELRVWDTSKMVIERYRPNVVFKGAGLPFAEDMWKELTISPSPGADPSSGGEFTLVCKCTRCMLPNIDPTDGQRNMSIPSKPLLKYRRGLDPGRAKFSCFGCNAVPTRDGILRVGDVVSVRTWDYV